MGIFSVPPKFSRHHCPKCKNQLMIYEDKEHSTWFRAEFILKCNVCDYWKYADNHKLAEKKPYKI